MIGTGIIVVVLLLASTSTYVPVWANAVSLAENSTRHAPTSARAWTGYAVALKENGYGLDKIRPALVKAMELDPMFAEPWSILAISLRDAGYGWDRIQPAMRKALQLDPDNTVALNLNAILLIEAGRLSDAEKILDALRPRVIRSQLRFSRK
jgi:Flp pilus assembly protein TadD